MKKEIKYRLKLYYNMKDYSKLIDEHYILN